MTEPGEESTTEVEELSTGEALGSLLFGIGMIVAVFSGLWWIGELLRWILGTWGAGGVATLGVASGVVLMAVGLALLHREIGGETA